MRDHLEAVILVALLAVSGCATGPGAPQVGREPGGLQVRVENESASNLRVFAVIGSSEVLLGRVDGNQNRTLRLPLGVSGAMQLVARPLATTDGRRHASEPFNLSEGQRMTWRLRESPGANVVPQLSTVQVFSCDPGRC